jgi:threonine/homoserine/homoserine lactone efflux protein
MSGEEPTSDGPATGSAATVTQHLDSLEPQLAGMFEATKRVGLEGAMQADGEIRRGLIALNGAGLLAVVSLLSQSLHPLIPHLAAGLYLIGLVFGCVAWVLRGRSALSAYFAEDAVRTSPQYARL